MQVLNIVAINDATHTFISMLVTVQKAPTRICLI